MPLYVGAGGVNKAVPVIHVGAGSAWKKVTGGWVGAGGVWKRIFPGNYLATLTSGTWIISLTQYAGYRRTGGTNGSVAPTNWVTDDHYLDDLYNTSGGVGVLRISNFVTNPGSSWLNYLKVASNTFNVGAATYSFSGISATWSWSGSGWLFGITGTNNYAIEISHN